MNHNGILNTVFWTMFIMLGGIIIILIITGLKVNGDYKHYKKVYGGLISTERKLKNDLKATGETSRYIHAESLRVKSIKRLLATKQLDSQSRVLLKDLYKRDDAEINYLKGGGINARR